MKGSTGALLVGAALLAWLAFSSDDGDTVKKEALHSPLVGKLRAITPHGDYHAPRYRRADNTTTGVRPTPTWPIDHYHEGIDLATEPREKVYAPGSGVVVPAGAGDGGIVVKMLLDDGRAVIYADLSRALVTPGERVSPTGAAVGEASARGFVHVAVRTSRGGPHIDPATVIPNATRGGWSA